jgi:hypothetical protein
MYVYTGYGNNIDEFKKFVEDLDYKDGMSKHDLFVFGKKIGTGEKNDNFQLGFTSKKLIKRMAAFKEGVFHIDGTGLRVGAMGRVYA